MNYGDSVGQRIRLGRVGPKIGHALRSLAAPFVASRTRLSGATFELWGRTYGYLSHPHNVTYRNERAVEIPVATDFLRRHDGRCLEFGHVLSHYGEVRQREIVDKYERADGVHCVDILEYAPSALFDCVVSVSTLEHVGRDEPIREPHRAILALDRLLSLLAPGGRLLVTASLGHNRELDAAIIGGHWVPERQASMIRVGRRHRNRWVAEASLRVKPYFGRADRGADAIWIAEFVNDDLAVLRH